MKRLSIEGLNRRMDELAAPVLTFLAADPERFDRFLALTGLDLVGLRAASTASGFAASLWSYLAGDEAPLLAFAHDHALDPDEAAMIAAAATRSPEEM